MNSPKPGGAPGRFARTDVKANSVAMGIANSSLTVLAGQINAAVVTQRNKSVINPFGSIKSLLNWKERKKGSYNFR